MAAVSCWHSFYMNCYNCATGMVVFVAIPTNTYCSSLYSTCTVLWRHIVCYSFLICCDVPVVMIGFKSGLSVSVSSIVGNSTARQSHAIILCTCILTQFVTLRRAQPRKVFTHCTDIGMFECLACRVSLTQQSSILHVNRLPNLHTVDKA